MSDWPAEVDLPIMHTYCFSKSSNLRKDVAERVNAVLGYEAIKNYKEDVRIVRDVAPNKLMMCAEFQLNRRISGNSGKRKIPHTTENAAEKPNKEESSSEKGKNVVAMNNALN